MGVTTTRIVKEGESTDIQCDTRQEKMVSWFRMSENGPVNFIASFSNGALKSGISTKFTLNGKRLTIVKFEKKDDAGAYSCVSINNNQLFFGEVTHLSGEPEPKKITRAPITTAPPNPVTIKTTTVACKPKETKLDVKLDVKLGCELQIFIPLAAGCGVLFFLLLITILYCNHIRTRRCPHHYKRQPRSLPAGHKPLPNPHGF
ncbi:T-cell surface glycoprotein CD8 alpha chain [Trichomycterus rosablanca]|uniref:T-cell surface glycoprotein CD8 alpha chain n=1 Tax=Trichomycterus rosablanca TaxID=2290929 RepID=UPI002F35B21E